MSDECGQDDEVTLTAAGKPNTAGFKKTVKRLKQGKDKRLGHRASLDWHSDSERVCMQQSYPEPVAEVPELIDILRQSRTASALMDETHPEVYYDMQIPCAQFYARGERLIITLNPARPLGDVLNTLARKLRRAWQHKQGALINPLSFEPDEAILVNRAQQADALMISVRIAWELKLKGESLMWDYIQGSPAADVGRSFETRAQKDFRTLNNGEAAREAYDRFFEDSRMRLFDKRIIHQMLLDENGYMKPGQTRARVSMDLFARLGEMPHGRNYFMMKNGKTPMDSCYSVVEDRSNANFLWFIKFERSYQEREMQLIKESVALTAEIIDFAKWSSRSRASRQG